MPAFARSWFGVLPVSFTKKLEGRDEIARHVESGLRRRESRARVPVVPAPVETPDQFLSWLTASQEEKAAALKEMSVDAYAAVGIPKDVAEKLHVDWLSALRSCAQTLTQAQFNFVINRNF